MVYSRNYLRVFTKKYIKVFITGRRRDVSHHVYV